MKKGIYIIPNSITLCGMTLGFYSILSSLKGDYSYAVWAILFANIADALDGWVARLTNSTSKFGVQLDSLSDMLTFGAAPAILVFSWGFPTLTPHRLGWAVSLFFVLCAALRLARFNVQVDTAECRSFTGMPTPSAATILTSGILVCLEEHLEYTWLPYVFLGLVFLLGLLMVSNVRYHSLKELNKLKKKPFWVLVMVAVMVLLILVNPAKTIFIASSLYLFSGLLEALYRLRHKRGGPAAKPGPAAPAASRPSA